MQTPAFIILALAGGLLTLFGVAGYSSYKYSKLPESATLFRWFIAGLIAAGSGAYAWIFGANGNPSEMMSQVSEILEVKNVIESVSNATSSSRPRSQSISEINVGMPNF